MEYSGSEIDFSITPYLLKDILNETLDCLICKDRLLFEGKAWQYLTTLELTKEK
jgi:hypothetical protein